MLLPAIAKSGNAYIEAAGRVSRNVTLTLVETSILKRGPAGQGPGVRVAAAPERATVQASVSSIQIFIGPSKNKTARPEAAPSTITSV
jgi:hypothetical protein